MLAVLEIGLDLAEGAAEMSNSAPGAVKPFFSCTLTEPPRAFRPNTGLEPSMFSLLIAKVGMRSKFTVSPKAWLKRTPFM